MYQSKPKTKFPRALILAAVIVASIYIGVLGICFAGWGLAYLLGQATPAELSKIISQAVKLSTIAALGFIALSVFFYLP